MKVLKNIVFWIATILMVLAIILVALPMLGQIDYKTIISGSMEPEIPVGSLIMIVKVDDGDIRIGDTITFSTSADITVTHKVVGYELSKNALITHGVANAEGVNEITPYKNVVGKVVLTIPVIGRAFLMISSLRGKIIAGTVIAVLYVLSVFFETLGSRKQQKEDDAEENDVDSAAKDNDSEVSSQDDADTKTSGTEPELGSWLDKML